MALRKIAGVNRGLFQHRFGVDPVDFYQKAWTELKSSGLADWDSRRVWLTPQGQMVLDGITEYLVSQVSVRSAPQPHHP
jgi:coproporphyrinogen III oxidase-like Fe-S oxidoreductase